MLESWRIVGEVLEDRGMSSIEILIKGEEAEAFAQGLLTIEGISRRKVADSLYQRKGKQEKAAAIINLTASFVTLSQGVPAIFQRITTYYKSYTGREKIEIKIFQNNNNLVDLPEFFAAFPSVDTSKEEISNTRFPSLQEIAKLPLPERYQLLAPFISDMAEDFKNDPELTIFSILDGEGLEENGN